MKRLLNILSLLGVITFCMKYYFLSKISVGFAAAVMIFTVILAALDSPLANFIKVGVAFIGFGLFLGDYFYDMNSFISLLQPVLTLLIALLAIYVIVRGFFGSSDKVKYEFDKRTGRFRKID